MPTLTAFFLKWAAYASLLMVREKVSVNNLQKTELLLFRTLDSLKACDCVSISGFRVAEWWNVIGLWVLIPPLLPLSLFLISSCLLWHNHFSYERIKERILSFHPQEKVGCFGSLPWRGTLKEKIGRASPFPGASARQQRMKENTFASK